MGAITIHTATIMEQTTTTPPPTNITSKPLHSPSSTPLSPLSHSRTTHKKTNTFLILTTLLSLLLVSTLPQSIEAKYRLIPKRRKRNQQQMNKSLTEKHGNTNSHTKKDGKKNANKDHSHLVVLKPKRKKQSLQLEATVHTNEMGEKVLMLSEESTEAVQTAMGQEKNSAMKMAPVEIQEASPVMGNSNENDDGAGGDENSPEVLFYDPDELKTKTKPGEPHPIPKRVFDGDGNEVDMAGQEVLLVKPKDHTDGPPPKVRVLTIILKVHTFHYSTALFSIILAKQLFWKIQE